MVDQFAPRNSSPAANALGNAFAIYDLRLTIWKIRVLRAEMRSESEGGRREHGVAVEGKGQGAGGS